MEQLLKKQSVRMMRSALNKQEECPLSAEYTLPEYCPDIAVILKCYAYPRIQNRQWSGDQLLLDGTAVMRVLYLDEERRCLHAVEFTEGFSCSFRSEVRLDNMAVQLDLATKYVNCRALSPRRIEVRGAVAVTATAECETEKEYCSVFDNTELHTRFHHISVTNPCGVSEKIASVSEVLDFPATMPPAEMLLGGECRVAVRECKLLTGKAIVKGSLYLHQIYTDTISGEHTYSLDYEIPFSQILDMEGAREGMRCTATAQVLTDTERCSSGDDGRMTVLEVTIKFLVQCRVYDDATISLLQDVYHSRYPITAHTESIEMRSVKGTRWEEAVIPLRFPVPTGGWSEILDIHICLLSEEAECRGECTYISGRLVVSVIARDLDGEIVHDEFVDSYSLEFPCEGNEVHTKTVVISHSQRVVDDTLELQVKVCVAVTEYITCSLETINDVHLQTDAPYPKSQATALFYYGAVGESVWDIGKQCHASPESIMDENQLTSECLTEPTVLFVPL